MTIQKGLGAIKSAVENNTGGATYLKIKPGEAKIIRFLVPVEELISVNEHVEQFAGQWKTVTCIGSEKGCPLCKAGLRATFHTYIPVIDKSDENKVKVLKAGVKMGAQILQLIEEYGDILRRDFKISRHGEKLNTQYMFLPKDPEPMDLSKFDVPDIAKQVQPKSIQEIEMLMGLGLSSGDSASDEDAAGMSSSNGAAQTQQSAPSTPATKTSPYPF